VLEYWRVGDWERDFHAVCAEQSAEYAVRSSTLQYSYTPGPPHALYPYGVPQTHFDTIVAPITGNQPAAVAWVRLSGPDSWDIASKIFGNWPQKPISHRATFGTYVHGDTGLALPFEENHSYTGEQSVELSIHGSSVSVRQLVEQCRTIGARMAEPGEFTLRAFLNGRIDLTQAEAVKDIVEAQTDLQLRSAGMNLKGELRREVTATREYILDLLARVEATVDFSEEIGELDRGAMMDDIFQIQVALDSLINTAKAGNLVRNGYRIAIVGPPNAGKSSLMNALLGEDRSIVTEIPGTTRDYLEASIEVSGLPVVLIDTAGLRKTKDLVESIGIQKTIAIAANADAVWYLYDASNGWTPSDVSTVESFERPVTVIANKADLAEASTGLNLSALTRSGIEDLLGALAEEIHIAPTCPLINLRHKPFLEQAKASINECLTALWSDAPDDLLSVLLTDAACQLGEITGETATPDMIERIFHDFCIGK